MNELNTFYFTYVCVVVTHDTCFTRKKPGNFLSWLTSLIAYFYFNSKISILDINLYKSSDASKKSEGCQCVCLIFSFPNNRTCKIGNPFSNLQSPFFCK